MTETERSQPAEPTELEGGGTEQTWGQGEGQHEPTLPDDESAAPEVSDESTPSYATGTAADLDDPDLALAREDEDMAR